MNGTLVVAARDVLVVAVDQAYGNCPRYIQQRWINYVPAYAATPAAAPSRRLDGAHATLIETADTFFLGTAHPTRGPTPPTAAVGPASYASTTTPSGGTTSRATTCSTASAISPSTPPRRPGLHRLLRRRHRAAQREGRDRMDGAGIGRRQRRHGPARPDHAGADRLRPLGGSTGSRAGRLSPQPAPDLNTAAAENIMMLMRGRGG